MNANAESLRRQIKLAPFWQAKRLREQGALQFLRLETPFVAEETLADIAAILRGEAQWPPEVEGEMPDWVNFELGCGSFRFACGAAYAWREDDPPDAWF